MLDVRKKAMVLVVLTARWLEEYVKIGLSKIFTVSPLGEKTTMVSRMCRQSKNRTAETFCAR